MSNLTAILLFLASLGIFFGYINPAYRSLTERKELRERSITELRLERDRYADALEKTREIEQTRTGLLEKYNAIPAEDRERLEKLLPDHVDSVRLIIDVNNMAAQYGMTLRNITLLPSNAELAGQTLAIGPQEGLFKAVGLKFSVTGSYGDFRAFLRDLERSLRLTDVKTVSFVAGKEEYTYSVTLVTYTLNRTSHAAF